MKRFQPKHLIIFCLFKFRNYFFKTKVRERHSTLFAKVFRKLIIVAFLGSWDREESLRTVLVDVSSQQTQLNNLRLKKKKNMYSVYYNLSILLITEIYIC